MNNFHTYNEEETIQAGKEFAARLKPGDIVACYGDLGSGKTRFIKGICEALGVREHIASPTFTIMNIYRASAMPVYHFDLYRISSFHELTELGFEEYIAGDALCLIEWAEKAEGVIPGNRYEIYFQLGENENERLLSIGSMMEVAA